MIQRDIPQKSYYFLCKMGPELIFRLTGMKLHFFSFTASNNNN